jgi:hypothetical protein
MLRTDYFSARWNLSYPPNRSSIQAGPTGASKRSLIMKTRREIIHPWAAYALMSVSASQIEFRTLERALPYRPTGGTHLRRAADTIKRQAELSVTDSRFDPCCDIGRIDDDYVSAKRLEFGHELRAPDDVDGLQAARFREGRSPTARHRNWRHSAPPTRPACGAIHRIAINPPIPS